ncbi:hypothetical protein T440DRAFT_298423 [Plenodomus tracheiphilus IPT5]|uniref:Uncharacterized protein n=1 Tax=Plenodomus tracheiphilus IPT5 TaxID=1408161 RepID=A0A6A7ANW4_9PLEO|nr:hypothetical protein T440DRAFT_298423 [Plenodomus tracheiphilus IPT5]
MHDEHPHPLLAQVPLTLSPFLSLPTAIPLPYSYKTLPSTLPPSIAQPNPSNPSHPPAYVQSSSGTTATPDQILTSCLALQQHLAELEADARRTLHEWEEKRKREELAEKRRVAPGWLDSGVHILKPDVIGDTEPGEAKEVPQLMDLDPQADVKKKEGEELDRVFGGLKV